MIPGGDFTQQSGKIKSTITEPTTERYLIIGTSVDGPKNIPTQVRSAQEFESIFGPANYSKGYKDPQTGTESGKKNEGSLPLAVSQAIAAGATDIWVVRATGTYATSASAFTNYLSLKSRNPGRIYNEVSMSVATTGNVLTVVLNQPAIKGGNFSTTYASSLTIGDFIEQFNGDRRNRTVFINRGAWSALLNDACTTIPSGSATLSGGTNGTSANGEDFATSKNGYATALTTTDTGTFDSLLGQKFRFDVAVLTGIYLDDQVVNGGGATSTTIATDYVLWLDSMSTKVSPCHGVISVTPPKLRDESDIIDWVNNNLLATSAAAYDTNLRWNCAGYFMYTGWRRTDPVAGTVDLGTRLSVVAGPEVVYSHPDIGTYSDNFHVSYGALLTTMPPEQAPIFRNIQGPLAYGTPIPGKYADKLIQGVGFEQDVTVGKGAYVVLTRAPLDPRGPLVVYSDVTAAERDDHINSYQVAHLLNSIQNDLYEALFQFIGKPTDAGALSAMDSVVRNVLDGYSLSGGIRGKKGVGYDYKLTMSGTDAALGIVRVHMELQPATALKKIYFVVAVRQQV